MKGVNLITYKELEQLRKNVNSLYSDIRKIEKEIRKTLQYKKVVELTKLKEQKEEEHEKARTIYIDAEKEYLGFCACFFYD